MRISFIAGVQVFRAKLVLLVAVQLRYLERYGSSGSLRGAGGNGGGRSGGAVIRVDGAGVMQVRAVYPAARILHVQAAND